MDAAQLAALLSQVVAEIRNGRIESGDIATAFMQLAELLTAEENQQ